MASERVLANKHLFTHGAFGESGARFYAFTVPGMSRVVTIDSDDDDDVRMGDTPPPHTSDAKPDPKHPLEYVGGCSEDVPARTQSPHAGAEEERASNLEEEPAKITAPPPPSATDLMSSMSTPHCELLLACATLLTSRMRVKAMDASERFPGSVCDHIVRDGGVYFRVPRAPPPVLANEESMSNMMHSNIFNPRYQFKLEDVVERQWYSMTEGYNFVGMCMMQTTPQQANPVLLLVDSSHAVVRVHALDVGVNMVDLESTRVDG